MASSLIANSLEQKRKFLCKKEVQLPQVWFGIPTWPPFCSILEHWYGETLIRILAVEVKVRHRAIDLFAHFPQYTSFATIHLICPPSPLPPPPSPQKCIALFFVSPGYFSRFKKIWIHCLCTFFFILREGGGDVKQGVLWRGVNSESRYHCRYFL